MNMTIPKAHDMPVEGLPHSHRVDAINPPVRSLLAGPDEVPDLLVDRWSDWQQQVIAAIRLDLHDVLEDVGTDDVDWEAWRPLFDEGRSAENAVARAFLRDG